MTPPSFLPMRVRAAHRLDDDELWALCRANPELRIERASDGELIIMSPTGGETGHRNFKITGRLALWAERDGTGLGFDSSTGFVLPNGAERSPDATWVRRDRWDALTEAQRRRFVPLTPDFVLELRSPSDELDDALAKMTEYLEQGTRLGWLLDPADRSVRVYRPGASVQHLVGVERVSGDPVLAGFELRLVDLW